MYCILVCVFTASALVKSRVTVSQDYYYKKNCAHLKQGAIASLAADFNWRLLRLELCGRSQSCDISKVEFHCSEQ